MNDDQNPATRLAFAASADGTAIAYERIGRGPALIVVGGALNDRRSAYPLAELLKDDFTVYVFDRRGRGESSDSLPYHVDREIEDLGAIITAAGGHAAVYGHSSGAILALLGAASGLPVTRLAVYEPPYATDKAAADNNRKMIGTISELVSRNQLDDAVVFFLRTTGMPLDRIEQMRQAPFWSSLVSKAPTLVYDLLLKEADGDALVPKEKFAFINSPLKAMAGGYSPQWMQQASKTVAESTPTGSYEEVPAQTHMVPETIIAPLLRGYSGGAHEKVATCDTAVQLMR